MSKHHALLQQKQYALDRLIDQIATWRSQGLTIVFTNGCFDILHLGHVDYLNRAADLGDVLLIGLNTDASVQRLKGEHRPIQHQDARATVLASLECVQGVILFDEPTPYELICKLLPDVLVKGADYQVHQIVGHDIVQAHGGTVETIPLIVGHSTTAIEQRIRAATKE